MENKQICKCRSRI